MTRRHFAVLLAGAGAIAVKAQNSPTNGPRSRNSFNAGWLFRRQANGGGALGSFDRDGQTGSAIEAEFRDAALSEYDDSSWQKISLPHTWNAHDGSDDVPGYFRGIGWYRKHFRLDSAERERRVFIEFEGVNQVSEFWVNGRHAGRHQGGYTSFEIDITKHVHIDLEPNVLTVKVDNLYNPDISPTVKTDLTFYGGIYRDAWLRITPPIYLADTFCTTPQVSAQSATVHLHTTVMNTSNRSSKFKVFHQILNPAGDAVADCSADLTALPLQSSGPIESHAELARPQLWSPDSPNLYSIRSRLLNSEHIVDETETRLGLRWFRFDPNEGFILNGRRLQLQGTTWHQSYPGLGSALPNWRHFADMKLIRDMGCNFFRTSHYPHDPAVVDACDRLGLLVLEEMFVGEEIENSKEYLAIQSRGCEEMIRRDRNHPSLVMWGFEGEIDSAAQHVEPVRALVRKLQELDPSRPATMQDARVENVKEALDVVGLYSTFENDDREHAQHSSRKYLIEEYTAAGIGRGIYGMGPQSEDRGCVEHEKFLAEVNKRRWIAGSALWHQFDYDGEEYDSVIPHVVTFGMADSWRIPKDVYYFYQSQWSAVPMLHICGHWTWPGTEGKPRSIKVYSNAPEVELFLNGKSLGTKTNVDGQTLAHPPRIWESSYEPGLLKAVARGTGETLVDERRTAGPPTKTKLETSVTQVQSGNAEHLAELTASICDDAGTLVPGAYLPVTFTLYGPGELLPQTWPGHPTGLTWNVVAGLTRILFRPTERAGRAVISVYSPGLELGRVEVDVFARGRRDEMEYRSGAKVYQ